MIERINATLNTGKKKILTFVLSGTLILALGSGVAYAASVAVADTILLNGFGGIAKTDNGNRANSVTDENAEDIETRPISDDDGVNVRASARLNEDGTWSYSTDGGKTWSKEVPEGLEGFSFSADPDGNGASGKLGN